MIDMYCTLEDADIYLESVLNTKTWDSSTDAKRTKALKQATRMIKAINVPEAVAYDYDPNLVVDPSDLAYVNGDYKAATVEIAIKVLEGYDPDLDQFNFTVKSFEFDNLSQTNRDGEHPLHLIAGIPSVTAFNLLRKYAPDFTTVRLSRNN